MRRCELAPGQERYSVAAVGNEWGISCAIRGRVIARFTEERFARAFCNAMNEKLAGFLRPAPGRSEPLVKGGQGRPDFDPSPSRSR